MDNKRYAWSWDKERYDGPHDTVEDAIGEAMAFGEDGYIWIGEVKFYDQYKISAESIIESLEEDLQEYFIDSDEINWLNDATKEQTSELEAEINKALETWLIKHKLKPSFFSVINVKKYDLEKETFVGV